MLIGNSKEDKKEGGNVCGLRKARGTRDIVVDICWTIEKEFKMKINMYFTDCSEAFVCVNLIEIPHGTGNGEYQSMSSFCEISTLFNKPWSGQKIIPHWQRS